MKVRSSAQAAIGIARTQRISGAKFLQFAPPDAPLNFDFSADNVQRRAFAINDVLRQVR